MKDPAGIGCLFYPVPGTGINERIGRRVAVHSLKIRGEIEIPNINDAAVGTQAMAGLLCRLIVCIDKQTNAVQMNSQNLIESGAANLAWDMFQATAAFGRFRILKDKRVKIVNPNFGADLAAYDRNGLTYPFEYIFKFRKPIHVHYNATAGGTVADIVDNSFHIMCAANNINANPTIQYKARICYTDV